MKEQYAIFETNQLTLEVQAFFDQVFGEQYQATFGQKSDKSRDGTLVFTLTENEKLVAAMSCERKYQAIKINDLAVRTDLHKAGLGSKLIVHTKDYAKENGVLQVLLTTRSYQAKDFYLKHGFSVFGELEDMPFAGVTTYYMSYRVN